MGNIRLTTLNEKFNVPIKGNLKYQVARIKMVPGTVQFTTQEPLSNPNQTYFLFTRFIPFVPLPLHSPCWFLHDGIAIDIGIVRRKGYDRAACLIYFIQEWMLLIYHERYGWLGPCEIRFVKCSSRPI